MLVAPCGREKFKPLTPALPMNLYLMGGRGHECKSLFFG
jgi:hypothetical protein